MTVLMVVERVNGCHLERWHEMSTPGPVIDDQHTDTEVWLCY